MAVQNLRQIEWEFVKQNYHFIPPIFQEYFEEIAVTEHIEDFEEFESAWYLAICAIQDQHEEIFMARKKWREEEVKNTKQKRVRLADLVKCHQATSTFEEKLVKVTLKVGEVVVGEENNKEVLPLSGLGPCGDALGVASSEVPQGGVESEVDDHPHSGDEPPPTTASSVPQEVIELEAEDEFHFGGVLIPATVSNVPQEVCELRVDDQFHFGGEPLPATVSSVPQEVLELQVDDQFHFGGVLIPAATSNVP